MVASTTQTGTACDRRGAASRCKSSRRQPIQILFVHRELAVVERCLHELHSVQFAVNPFVAHDVAELAKRLASQRYDLIVVEHPGADLLQTIEILNRTKKKTPLIFLTDTLRGETATEFAQNGGHDCIELDRIARLPMAVRRVLDEKMLREERDRAEKELRRSKAHYRALVENAAVGMCRCRRNGRFLDVNHVLVAMLGYESSEELKSANLAGEIIQHPVKRAQLLDSSLPTGGVNPVEADWKRKDGTMLRVRLSGRKILGEKGALGGYGIIVEDVTDQRALEDKLRQRADRDGLTGLANYRMLVEVLDAEITRSKRTEREFSLLFLDLDRLKQINDRYGHEIGSRALCRLANVLRLCCRSVDTAARYGGDEFALVLPETGERAATLAARRVSELVAIDREEPNLTVSIGIASYPKDADSIGSLLHAADKALYLVKNQRKRPSPRNRAPGADEDQTLTA
jgi:diguanylate cyclase (GGDEF)-like protein/PAS domain S-box-containing protein